MLDAFAALAAGLVTAVALWHGGGIWWSLIGWQRGLRNPWVFGPLLLSLLGLVLASAEAARMDRVHDGLASARPEGLSGRIVLVCMSIAVIGAGLSILAAFRRDRRINALLRISEMNLGSESISDDDALIREQAEALARRPEMEALLKLVEQTGGAPAHDWVTPQWVRTQLDALAVPANENRIYPRMRNA